MNGRRYLESTVSSTELSVAWTVECVSVFGLPNGYCGYWNSSLWEWWKFLRWHDFSHRFLCDSLVLTSLLRFGRDEAKLSLLLWWLWIVYLYSHIFIPIIVGNR